MKKYLPIFGTLLCVCASLFIAYSVSPSLADDVYDIDPDVSPFYISPGAGVRQYRYNADTGKWQYQTTVGGSWYDASTTSLTTMLNYLSVATTQDVSTAVDTALNSLTIDEDMLTALGDYFGDSPHWPGSIQYFFNGNSGPITQDTTSLMHWLNRYVYASSYNLMFDPGWSFLNLDGKMVHLDTYAKFPYVLNTAVSGLGALLGGGPNYDKTYSGLSSSGMSTGAMSGPYLQSISSGMAGLGRLLTGGSGNRSMMLYVPGLSEQFTYTASDILSFIIDSSENQSRLLTSQHPYLNGSGITTNNIGLTSGIADLVADGFNGISHNLIGSGVAQYGYDYEIVNYKDLSTTEYTSDNILEYLVNTLSQIQSDLAMYMYSHGTDLDIKERENMEEQAEQFVDDFTDPSGQGTPTTGQISDTAGVSGGLKDAFSSTATPADAFGQITDEQNYSFFSSEVQNSLNPFYASRQRSRSSDDVVDNVTPKLREIMGGLGKSW